MGDIKYKAVDFFCGGGGMTCGLRQAGINVIAGVDFDKDCKETYEFNNPESSFVLADITKLPSNYFTKKFGLQKDDNNLIFIGCSPCQYYSLINTSREKSLASKDLLIDFKRFIEYYNPGYVLVENVPGILSNRNSILPTFLEFLQEHGYNYIEYAVVDMSYYGVPQKRRRFSLIASRVGPVELPRKEAERRILRDYIGEANGFPSIIAGHRDETVFNHTTSALSPINLERIMATPHNGGNRLAWKDNPHLQVPCFIGKDKSFVDTYGRMWWDQPASTITTKFYSISNGRFGHPEENRGLSLREGATLQTFPRNYVFKTNSVGATAKLIGNAVPPEYARRLGLIINR
ncbi:MAG: DNA cytosine methyltransferase [Bacteroidota bacterium]|nr:DNA cytosine methyltransferase [Bacteroidota bacterium]